MILVETSALISFLRGKSTASSNLLKEVFESGEPYALCPIIVEEVLQGALDLKEWRTLDTYLESQPMIYPRHPLDTYRAAARIYFDCRRHGKTVRTTIDCLIAQIALEHDAYLLTEDRDFYPIAALRPLRIVP